MEHAQKDQALPLVVDDDGGGKEDKDNSDSPFGTARTSFVLDSAATRRHHMRYTPETAFRQGYVTGARPKSARIRSHRLCISVAPVSPTYRTYLGIHVLLSAVLGVFLIYL